MNAIISETVRVIVLTTISFVIALIITPLWYNVLKKYRFGKHLREAADAPVFHEFHKNKEGVPTAAGVIIWGTVLLLAAFFGTMGVLFDGMWHYFNFISRPETYLPLAALILAAILGFADDWLGILRIGGGSGGGLSVRYKSIVYTSGAYRRVVVLFSPRVGRFKRAVFWQCPDRYLVHSDLRFHYFCLGIFGKRDRWPGRASRRCFAFCVSCARDRFLRAPSVRPRRVLRRHDWGAPRVPLEQYLSGKIHDGGYRFNVLGHHDRCRCDAYEHGAPLAVFRHHISD